MAVESVGLRSARVFRPGNPASSVPRPVGNRPHRGILVSKRIAWLALAILLPGLGCGRTKPPPPPVVLDKVTLKIACPGDPSAAVVKRYGQGWATAQNAQLEIVRVAATERRDGLDVWIIPPPALPHLAAAGLLQPVPDSLLERGNGYQWQNLFPLYRHKLLTWDGKPYALPLLGDARVLYVREDWLRDSGKSAPETWEAFAELAEFFHDRDKAPSLPPLPERSEEINNWLYTIAASYDRHAVREDAPKMPTDVELFSFHYDLETMRPRLATPAFVHALTLLRRLQPCRPEGTAAEPIEAFRQARPLSASPGPSGLSASERWLEVRGKLHRRCPAPPTLITARASRCPPGETSFHSWRGRLAGRGAEGRAECRRRVRPACSPQQSGDERGGGQRAGLGRRRFVASTSVAGPPGRASASGRGAPGRSSKGWAPS